MSGRLIDDYHSFLAAIWGHGLHSVNWRAPGYGFRFEFAATPADVVARLERLQSVDAWIGVHPLRHIPATGRGDRDDVLEVVALSADLDWDHPTRRTTEPLPTEAEVRYRLRLLGSDLQPSIVVHSGHGLQPWWLLASPVGLDEAEELIAQLDAKLAKVGLVNGRPDLASILRLPGTRNHKDPDEIPPVIIETMDLGWRFVPEYLHEHLPAAVATRSGSGTKHRRGSVTDDQQALLDHIVTHHGAHSVDVWRDGSMHVVRPGKDAKNGSSASIITGEQGDAVLTVFTENWPVIGKLSADDPARCWVLGVDGELHHPSDPTAKFKINSATTPDDESNGDGETFSPHGVFVRASQVRSKLQRWAWLGRLPLGELTIAGGREKLGKSTAMVWVSARLTLGLLPGHLEGDTRDVVFVSGEDHYSRVLKPRLVLAGADLDRVHLLDPDGPGFSVDAVRALPESPALIVLDPLSLFLDVADVHEHGEMATRKGLRPLVLLAQELEAAVVGIRHLRKDGNASNPYDVLMGSRAYSAAARSVMFFTPDPRHKGEPKGLLFARGNLAASSPGHAYELTIHDVALDDGNTAPHPLFEVSDLPAGIDLEDALDSNNDKSGELERAVDWLKDLLDGGPQPTVDVERLAKDNDIAPRTLKRARESLGVVATRVGGLGRDGHWELSLPKRTNLFGDEPDE